MVEIEVRKSEPEKTTTNIDIGQIINKVRDFVSSIREMSPEGKPMTVKVEGFNFSIGKKDGEYDLTLMAKIAISPKED